MYANRNEKFKKDLSVAQKYEKWIGKNFKVINYNDDYRYDLLLKNGIKIEIKHDYQTKTGNIAIEYECDNKPSCISTTEADYMIYIFPLLNEIWKIKVKKLKKLIDDFKYGLYNDNYTSELYFRKVEGGDYDKKTDSKVSKLYLLRRNEVSKYFDILKKNVPKYK